MQIQGGFLRNYQIVNGFFQMDDCFGWDLSKVIDLRERAASMRRTDGLRSRLSADSGWAMSVKALAAMVGGASIYTVCAAMGDRWATLNCADSGWHSRASLLPERARRFRVRRIRVEGAWLRPPDRSTLLPRSRASHRCLALPRDMERLAP